MTSTILPLRALLLFLLSLVAVMRAAPLYAATDVRGTWTGTFSSNHSGVAPFTITVVIDADSNGHLVGTSTLNSRCLKGASLHVTVTGSTVVLAGSDRAGNNMTLRGSLDDTASLLKSAYIFNGSAGGGCETDDGTGTLTKR
jgi:nitrous oxidase accessory protein NosD